MYERLTKINLIILRCRPLTRTLTLSLVFFIGGCSMQKNQATAEIKGLGSSPLSGVATFIETKKGVEATISLSGYRASSLGVHLHAFGDCSAEDGSSAGGHWNPTNEAHGAWGGDAFHSGDIGNIIINEDKKGSLVLLDKYGRWTINKEDKTNLLGKAIIIHAKSDDKTTQPTGAAGARIGCGEIKIKTATQPY